MNTPTKEQIARLPKWAREAWEKRDEELRLARALCWPVVPSPSPMDIGEILKQRRELLNPERLVTGWSSHSWDLNWRVTLGCSNGVNHDSHNALRTSTQGPGVFYSSEVEALLVARWRVCKAAAKTLAEIDKRIEEASPE